RVLMLENAVYTVITPEGCASITWRDANMKARAATALKPTAAAMRELELIDEVVSEPAGGAHGDPAAAAQLLGDAIERHLSELAAMNPEQLAEDRYRRFRNLGAQLENSGGA
ncbi:MAG: acetyl-CoA carboxylase carboxyltransferase subunit alpha, partial [Terriglobales bacterium]